MTAAAAATPETRRSGGAFLAGPTPPNCVRTPEDLPAEARLMADTMERFVRSEVLPRAAALEAHEAGLLRRLLQDAARLGLLAGGIPSEYGGLGLSRATLALLYERAALCPSFALTHNVHSGVATLPLAWFGTEPQKKRYLPAMAGGETIGAFALTEANAGSDALSARCHAAPAPDGGFRLTGAKNWITNAGLADLFTVFARIGGATDARSASGLTAFLVERNALGVSLGREEEKMGLHGASTRALYLDDVAAPPDGVLGVPGEGHRVALNPLNVGRLNIGASALGASKANLLLAAHHAGARRQFGRALADLGLIRQKLGEMAARTFAAESMVYRVAGLLDGEPDALAHHSASTSPAAAAAEYAVECALVKVYATETLDLVVDESLQIHGGYGYGETYPAARAYRDARVMRLFEGTNEINRLTAADQIARRVRSERLTLAGPDGSSPLMALRGVVGRIMTALWERCPSTDAAQEAYAACADMALALFAAESAALRAARLTGISRTLAEDAAGVVLADACTRTRTLAGGVCRFLNEPERWGRLASRIPELWLDGIAARRRLADALRDTDRWPWEGCGKTDEGRPT